ncbi:TPA: hypothetical protein ACWYGP_003548 [Raoultella planticola]
MNIETVNELIASLESAGELSIKELKYLDLAKAYVDREAESVALALTFEKCREITNCPAGVDLQDHLRQLAAESVALKEACGGNGSYRNCPACTFSEYIKAPETHATDRIVAGIKADGVEEWVSSRGGRWNGTTKEALKFARLLRDGADK